MTESTMTQERGAECAATSRMDGPIVLAMKPFDGTASPLAVARWLAHREDRELHLVSVIEDGLDAMTIAAGLPVVSYGQREDELEDIAARLRSAIEQPGAPRTRNRVDVFRGQSAHTIVEIARERNARLIVIGTGHHERLERIVYGERAMQIVQAADRPVMVVPRGAAAGPLARIVVAVDFSRAALRAARAAIPMLQPGGELVLLHARASERRQPGEGPMALDATSCDGMFASFIRLLDLAPHTRVRTQVVWGPAVDVIVSFATAVGAGAVACGRLHSHTLAERVSPGSVSAGLLRHVRCPILIAPETVEDARDDARSPLTGISPWRQDAWRAELHSFSHRNVGRRVRVGVESKADRGACVAQNYRFRDMSLDASDHVRLIVEDVEPHASRLDLSFDDVRTMTRRTNAAGDDTHLVFEYAGGRGTLTLTAEELP